MQATRIAETEWETFREERTAAVEAISTLRRNCAELESSTEVQAREKDANMNGDEKHDETPNEMSDPPKVVDMDVDDANKEEATEKVQSTDKPAGETTTKPNGEEEDAVEY